MSDESTVSTNVKLVGPNGADVMLTIRAGATTEEVLGVLDVMAQSLTVAREKYHLTPPARNGNGNGNGANGNGDAPVCPVHGKPMKKSQYEGWYCPRKNEDGSYCKEKVKA